MENNIFSMNKKLNKLESNKVIINDNHDVEIENNGNSPQKNSINFLKLVSINSTIIKKLNH